MMKCGRCGSEINGNKCSAMSLTPQYPHSVWENRWMLLCDKCSACLVQWLSSGDPIQERIKWFGKWRKRWLKIAEKFKEDK